MGMSRQTRKRETREKALAALKVSSSGTTKPELGGSYEVKPPPEFVWHYTVGACIEKILADGELRPSTMAQGREKSILWFSTNSEWEQSARKVIVLDGKKISLDKLGTEQLYNGLYRIGVPSHLLTPWSDLQKLYKPESVSTLEDARRFGSNPSEWWGSLTPIRSEHWFKKERFDKVWRELNEAEIPKAHLPTLTEILAFLELRNLSIFQLLKDPTVFLRSST
jgi:hypothetical protein